MVHGLHMKPTAEELIAELERLGAKTRLAHDAITWARTTIESCMDQTRGMSPLEHAAVRVHTKLIEVEGDLEQWKVDQLTRKSPPSLGGWPSSESP